MNNLYQLRNNSLQQSQLLQNPVNSNPNLTAQIQQIKDWKRQLELMNNPEQGIQNLIAQNPKLREIVNLVNQIGQNPQQLFYQMSQKMGVNPNLILNLLR